MVRQAPTYDLELFLQACCSRVAIVVGDVKADASRLFKLNSMSMIFEAIQEGEIVIGEFINSRPLEKSQWDFEVMVDAYNMNVNGRPGYIAFYKVNYWTIKSFHKPDKGQTMTIMDLPCAAALLNFKKTLLLNGGRDE